MKSKGAVKFFAIALAVVCLFQLSFTFIGNYYDKKAERFATLNVGGNKTIDEKRKKHYLDSVSHETILNLGIRKYNYLDIKERTINLGLDLRGGMHVTLAVDMYKFLKQLSGDNSQPEFTHALEAARSEAITSQRNFIDIFADALHKEKPGAKLAPYFATLENKGRVDNNDADQKVVTFLKDEARSALERTYEILRTRIDKFGVTQPNIQPIFDAGRILVEMPGVDDADRVRKLLKSTAKLEFYETYKLGKPGSPESGVIFSFLEDADKALYSLEQAKKGGALKGLGSADTTHANKKDSTATTTAGNEGAFSLLGGKKDTTKTPADTSKKIAANDSAAKAAKKKEEEKRDKPLFRALFSIEAQKQGIVPPQDGNTPAIGYVSIKDTARVSAMLNAPEVRNAFPSDVVFTWGAKPVKRGSIITDIMELYALRSTGLQGHEAVLYGDVITDARQNVDPTTNSYIVEMQMNSEGATDWRNITSKNAKNHGFVAIVLDKVVYSAPRVMNEIPTGNSQIQGDFSVSEAKDLANILKAGKLPVELQIINEAIVGPSLGAQSIRQGLLSLFVGLIAIIAFMIFYYNRSGWVATLALFVNIFFIIGILASLNAALTLPGMAGIVLTLAMAVDANVLIYERCREELAHGKALKLAIADGFRHALASIIDGHLVTMLIGIVLMAFGSGPIYGFAVVLVIGILTSLFTSILISRIIFEWLLLKDSKITFGNKVTYGLFKNIHFDFMGKRKYGYWFSGITLAIGISSLAFNGLKYGVDFEGGYSYSLDFAKPVQTEEVRNLLKVPFGDVPEVKTFGADNKVAVTTNYLLNVPNQDSADNMIRAKMKAALEPLNNPYTIESSTKVGSTIANDIKRSAFWSILIGLLIVFVYIVIRFKRWQFASGATLALAHDAFFVLSLFSIFRNFLPFSDVDQAVVAALLTIVGYSINDTVIVFDRIREYLRANKKSQMVPTVNTAMNVTLSRTIITSFTVFMAVFILFLFGGSTIRGFSFAMMVGVIVGTYSSVFVATPLAIDLHKKEELDSVSF